MAAKKSTQKSTSSKGKAKPAVKSSKASSSVKKKPVAKKAASAKKAAPAKKAVPAKKVVEKAAKPAKKTKVAAKKKPSRSSLVNFPVPPAPVRPKFVPPATMPQLPGSGNQGSHNSSFIKKQLQRLLDLRDELVDAMSGMTRDTIRNAPEGSEASGSGQHQGDAGSDAYDRDFALSVLANEQDALYEIEQALRRIDAGSYGVCELSACKIPQMRLEAIPFARLTVECQTQWEKEYGNKRFRPSDEVGFDAGKNAVDDDIRSVSLDGDQD